MNLILQRKKSLVQIFPVLRLIIIVLFLINLGHLNTLDQMLNLTTNSNHKLYKLPRIFKDENMIVKQQVKEKLFREYYEKNVLYYLVPIETCNILLE